MTETIFSLIFPVHGSNRLQSGPNQHNLSDQELTFGKKMILFGEDTIYRSSLLFQACLSAALCKREVVFICKEQFQTLPMFVHNMPKPNEEILNLIKFKYLSTKDELIDYLSQIHTEPGLPCMLVLDNIQNYIDNSKHEQTIDQLQQASLISAHISEAIDYINTKSFCVALVSSNQLQNDQMLKNYFTDMCYIKPLVKDRRFMIMHLMTEADPPVEQKIQFRIQGETIVLAGLEVTKDIVTS